MAYYYLAASLPALTLDQPPSMKVDAYVELCRDHLSPKDQAAVDALAAGHPPVHPLAMQWQQSETQLRNCVARHRAQRRQIDASSLLREHTGYQVAIETGVERALQAADPLQRERALDELRWQLIDDLQGTDEFGSATVITYLLRLQLCTRWNALTVEQGKARMEDTLASTSPDGPETQANAQ